MREIPAANKSSDKILFAASDGWNPSQNTYSVAFLHVPGDFLLHSIDVSTNPVPQHAFLASKKPAFNYINFITSLRRAIFNVVPLLCIYVP